VKNFDLFTLLWFLATWPLTTWHEYTFLPRKKNGIPSKGINPADNSQQSFPDQYNSLFFAKMSAKSNIITEQ